MIGEKVVAGIVGHGNGVTEVEIKSAEIVVHGLVVCHHPSHCQFKHLHMTTTKRSCSKNYIIITFNICSNVLVYCCRITTTNRLYHGCACGRLHCMRPEKQSAALQLRKSSDCIADGVLGRHCGDTKFNVEFLQSSVVSVAIKRG